MIRPPVSVRIKPVKEVDELLQSHPDLRKAVRELRSYDPTI
jgi:predicted RNase H-like nuclease